MHTGLSPEWDRGFDEVFAEIVSGDEDLLRAEFDSLMRTGGFDARWPVPIPRRSVGDTFRTR